MQQISQLGFLLLPKHSSVCVMLHNHFWLKSTQLILGQALHTFLTQPHVWRDYNSQTQSVWLSLVQAASLKQVLSEQMKGKDTLSKTRTLCDPWRNQKAWLHQPHAESSPCTSHEVLLKYESPSVGWNMGRVQEISAVGSQTLGEIKPGTTTFFQF